MNQLYVVPRWEKRKKSLEWIPSLSTSETIERHVLNWETETRQGAFIFINEWKGVKEPSCRWKISYREITLTDCVLRDRLQKMTWLSKITVQRLLRKEGFRPYHPVQVKKTASPWLCGLCDINKKSIGHFRDIFSNFMDGRSIFLLNTE